MMQRMPRVTVIIATYNWSSVLRYAIASVLRQTYTDFELLVAGDACTDDSESVVSSFGDARVRWINLPENTGHQTGPNNEALRQARGELIAYLGHDDLWLPHHLESVVRTLDASGSDLAYSLGMNVAADGQFLWPTIPRPKSGVFASPLCVVHRKRVTDEIGGWPHSRDVPTSPDVELWRRAQAAGFAFTFVPRFTAIKFPASHRRGVYATRPSHEQAAWTARIESEPDLEAKVLAGFIAGDAVPIGMSYRDLFRHFVRQTFARVRIRLAGVTRRRGGVDTVRRFKGL